MYCSDYILDEAITTCYSRTRRRKSAVELGRTVLDSKSIVMLEVNKAVFNEAWRIFSGKFLDIPLSFTDCTTYVLMRNNSISTIFTFDKEFDGLGFNRFFR